MSASGQCQRVSTGVLPSRLRIGGELAGDLGQCLPWNKPPQGHSEASGGTWATQGREPNLTEGVLVLPVTPAGPASRCSETLPSCYPLARSWPSWASLAEVRRTLTLPVVATQSRAPSLPRHSLQKPMTTPNCPVSPTPFHRKDHRGFPARALLRPHSGHGDAGRVGPAHPRPLLAPGPGHRLHQPGVGSRLSSPHGVTDKGLECPPGPSPSSPQPCFSGALRRPGLLPFPVCHPQLWGPLAFFSCSPVFLGV